MLGVCGAVGSTYNFAGRHYLKLMHSFADGDKPSARAQQFLAARMIEVLGKYGFMAASKAIMGLIGVDCGPVRPPLRNLTSEELAAMARELAAFDVFSRPLKTAGMKLDIATPDLHDGETFEKGSNALAGVAELADAPA